MSRLTTKQKELLEFIKAFAKKNFYSPTHREIKETLGIVSCSHLDSLVYLASYLNENMKQYLKFL